MLSTRFFARPILPRPRSLAVGLIGLACSCTSVAVAQQPTTPNPPESDQVLRTFRDAFGREMEEVLVTRHVTEYRTELKEVKESRAVQEWVTENQTTIQHQVTPTTQYQMQPRWVGRFNPFTQPRLTYDYVPITTYQSNPIAANVPVAIPKWTTKEVSVTVPQVVPTTRATQYRVIRPKLQSLGNGSQLQTATNLPPNSSQPNPTNLATLPRANPSQWSANQAMLDRSAPNPALTPTPVAPTSVASYAYNPPVPLGAIGPQPLINPSRFLQGGRLVNLSPQSGYVPPISASPSVNSLPAGNPPSILPVSRPLFANNFLRPSTAQAYPYPPTNQLPRTAAIPGNQTWREPSQRGLPPSELR